ncbi:Nuf2 family-domain-containing protein [Phycomyces blakesleeanus]|uniref:Nuf2 family-domain-containing protein n=1 Tax=Phycomyces blakesleeanus TaxID=4837 RepID=A0ABR3AWR8_PHYBL
MEELTLRSINRRMSSFRAPSFNGDSTIYDLPIFKMNDLCVYLKDMGFNVTKRQLTHPEAKDIVLIYKGIIQILRPSWSQRMDQELNQLLSRFDYPDLRISVISTHVVAKYMKRLLTDIRFNEFDVSDIIHPDPNRLARILSAAINYSNFTNQSWERFYPYVAKHKEFSSRIRETMDDINALQREKSRLIAERVAAEPEKRQIEEENEMYERKLLVARQHTEALQNNINAIKKEKNVLKDTLQELLFKGLSIDEELSQLEIRLRINPKEEEKLIEELKQKIQEEHVLEKKATESFESLVRILDFYNEIRRQYSDVKEILETLLDLMKEWDSEKNTAEAAHKEYIIQDTNLKSLRTKKNRLVSEIDSLRLKEKQDLDELERTREHVQIQFGQLELVGKQAAELTKEVRKELIPLQTSNDELSQKISANKERNESLISQLELKYKEVNSEAENILRLVDSIIRSFNNTL